MHTREIRQFRRVLRRFERITNAQLKSCCAQVSLAQCLVLLEVDENDRLTMGQLASRLRLDNSTLSRTVDGLVSRGLVERLREDRDRRVVWIRLTEAGAKVCESIHDENDALYGRIFDRISPTKQKTVVSSFETLVQAFLDAEGDSQSDACCEPGKSVMHSSKRTRNRRGAQSK
jgi:DNA-binding MarR family transcriptional regulator